VRAAARGWSSCARAVYPLSRSSSARRLTRGQTQVRTGLPFTLPIIDPHSRRGQANYRNK